MADALRATRFSVDDHGMLLAVATCASTARWSFLRALTCRRERRNFTRNGPEASCRLVFRCDVSPIFSVRGPVEDDGNGRGLSLAGLGICGHQEALPVRRTS